VTFTAEVSLCLQSDFPAFLPRFCAAFLAQPQLPAPIIRSAWHSRSMHAKDGHSQRIFDTSPMRLSIDFVYNRPSIDVRGGVGDASILDFVSGSTSRIIVMAISKILPNERFLTIMCVLTLSFHL
jgi:hypothetical protein